MEITQKSVDIVKPFNTSRQQRQDNLMELNDKGGQGMQIKVTADPKPFLQFGADI
jgi:hypothetical protein